MFTFLLNFLSFIPMSCIYMVFKKKLISDLDILGVSKI